MNVKELMLEDYVWSVANVAPFQVDIYCLKDFVENDEIFRQDIEPIILTKEILDKNFRGYSQRYNGWNDVIYYDVKDEYEIHLTGNDVSLNINYDDSEHAAHDKIYLFDLPYVHTLQHALRLIGYDKEVII